MTYRKRIGSAFLAASILTGGGLAQKADSGLEGKLDIQGNPAQYLEQESLYFKDVYRRISQLIEANEVAKPRQDLLAILESSGELNKVVAMISQKYELGADAYMRQVTYDRSQIVLTFTGYNNGTGLTKDIQEMEVVLNPEGRPLIKYTDKKGGKVILPLPAANIVR